MSTEDIAIVVDQDDNVITYKKRSELLPDDYHRISAVWIQNSADQVLIAKRASTKEVDPDCWGPAAAGTLDKSETYEQNAYKELSEELGVSGIELKLLAKHVYISTRGHHRVCQWFGATLDWPIEQFSLQADEVAAVRWIDKAALVREIREQPESFVASAVMWDQFFDLSSAA